MWFKNIKEAGADEVLRGDLIVKDNICETVNSYYYVYSVSDLPSTQSIDRFLSEDIPKFDRYFNLSLNQIDPNSSDKYLEVQKIVNQYKCLERFIRTVIETYSKNPKYVHLIYKYYLDLSNLIRKIQNLRVDYPSYIIEKDEDRKYGDSTWLSTFLQIGYTKILNLEKAGLFCNPEIKFAIMSDMDIKSNPKLKNEPGREELKSYFEKKYPFFARFEPGENSLDVYKNTLINCMRDNEKWDEEVWGSMHGFERSEFNAKDFVKHAIFNSSIPKNDANSFFAFALENSDPDNYSGLPGDIFYGYGEFNNETANFTINTILDNQNNLDTRNFKDLFTLWFDKMSVWDIEKINYSTISRLKNNHESMNILQDLYTGSGYDKTKIIYLGLAGLGETINYAIENPSSISNIRVPNIEKLVNNELKRIKKMTDKLKIQKPKNKKDSEEETKENNPENEKPLSELEKIKREQNNIMQKNIDSGNIDEGKLSQIYGGKFLNMTINIGTGMRLDPEVVKKWADKVNVYIVHNGNFYKQLREIHRKGFDTINDFESFVGCFVPYFSKNGNKDNREPAIFLNEYIIRIEHASQNIFKVLDIPSSVSQDSIASHEIAHALNYLATGQDFVRESEPSGNKDRDYLASYVEIIARIYGEYPVWRDAIFNKIDSMRTSTLIQRAVQEEVKDEMLTSESSKSLGLPDIVKEFKYLDRNVHPYNKTENPMAALQKRINRTRAKVKEFIDQGGKDRRREIVLDILKEINSLKKQLSMIQKTNTELKMPEETRQIQSRLNKLEKMKLDAMNGGYDHDIDTSVSSVINNFLIRKMEGQAKEILMDPSWRPPETIFNKGGEDITPAWKSGEEPLSYDEMQNLINWTQEMSKGTSGGKTQAEPKMLEMFIPPHSPTYKEDFEKNSFNFNKWLKSN